MYGTYLPTFTIKCTLNVGYIFSFHIRPIWACFKSTVTVSFVAGRTCQRQLEEIPRIVRIVGDSRDNWVYP